MAAELWLPEQGDLRVAQKGRPTVLEERLLPVVDRLLMAATRRRSRTAPAALVDRRLTAASSLHG